MCVRQVDQATKQSLPRLSHETEVAFRRRGDVPCVYGSALAFTALAEDRQDPKDNH